jgi:hypothetical protein
VPSRVVLPVLVLAAALAAWLLLGGQEEPSGPDLLRPARDPVASTPFVERTTPPPAPSGTGAPARPTPPPPPPSSAADATTAPAEPPRSLTADEIRNLPRGDLVVRVVDLDGNDLPPEGVDVRVSPKGRKDWVERLGELSETRAEYRFTELLAGAVEIVVRGERVLERRAEDEVLEGRQREVTVAVERGASVRFVATFEDGAHPESMVVTVLGEDGRPRKAWFDSGGQPGSLQTAAAEGLEAKVGARGRIWGLRAGRYQVRVVVEGASPVEEWVDATAGSAADLALTIRK